MSGIGRDNLEGSATCADVHRLASDYHDGDLDSVRRVGFERHLESCSPCQGFYQSFEHTVRRAREAVRADVPGDLAEVLWTALAPKVRRPA